MNLQKIRLNSHYFWKKDFESISQIINHFWCIQAQDENQAIWCLWSRLKDANSLGFQKAYENKEIIKTWTMRWTLHYVAPNYVKMFLKYCASKTISWFKKRREFLWISDELAEKSIVIIKNNLAWWKILTRSELTNLLKENGIPMQTQWTYHLTCYAWTLWIICFWPPRWNEDTFVLLDEWISDDFIPSKEEAILEITKIYLRWHSPILLDDLAWWTWLWKTDFKIALEKLKDDILSYDDNWKKYYCLKEFEEEIQDKTRLIWWFDEYFLWYKDRSLVCDLSKQEKYFTKNGIFFPLILKNWKVVWVWKRKFKKDMVEFSVEIVDCDDFDISEIEQEAWKYANFFWYEKFKIFI
jgi:hypothetical protein